MNNMLGGVLRQKEKRTDIIALICIALLFAVIFLALPYGIGIVDESFYYATAQRVIQGDRLLVDEWQVSQLFSLLLIIPVRIYELIFGSTDGIILGMRYLYVTCEFVLGVYLWKKLKQYGYPALFFVLAICSFGPMYTFSYYNVAVNGTALICAVLFSAESRPKRYQLFFSGIVAAVVVLAEPLLALLYFVFTLLVFFFYIKRKKSKNASNAHFLFDPSSWAYLTLGILLIAIPFFLYYLSSLNWDLKPLFENIVGIASDSGHELSAFNFLYPFAKIYYYASHLTGPVFTVLAVLTVLAACVVKIRKIEDRRVKAFLFFFASGLYCLTYLYSFFFFFNKSVRSFLYHYNFRGYSVPIMFLGLICILLSDHVRPVFYGFWYAGFLVSYLEDVNSQTGYGSSGIICLLPSSILFFELFRRFLKPGEAPALSEDNASGSKKQAARGTKEQKAFPAAISHFLMEGKWKKAAAMTLCACVIGVSVFWVGENLYVRTLSPCYERWEIQRSAWQPVDVKISKGPLRGILTTETIADNYNAQMEDMAYLMDKGSGNLYVTEFCPLPYIYTNFPMGIYSSCYVEEDIPARPLLYWKLHPDRVPAYIYVPFCSASYYPVDEGTVDETFERLDRFFDYSKEEGKGGFIVYIKGVRTLDGTPEAYQS